MTFISMRRSLATLVTAVASLLVVACGGGGNSGDTLFSGSSGSGGTGGTGGATSVLAIEVQLLDATETATASVVAGQPVQAKAVLKRNGTVLKGEIVQFSIVQTATLAQLTPVSGSALTDKDGVASVSVASLGTAAGAGRVQATATVAGVTATGSANFYASGTVGTQPTTLALSPVTIQSPTVSAYGTTGVEVTVLQSGAPYTSPVTVNFTSSCAAGKATITTNATTQPNGKATGTFVDNGCAAISDSVVTITASIGTDTKSSNVTVRAPTAGSLRFVGAVPSDNSITLRGQGGAGRQENAILTFKLVDVAGNGVGNADVCFDATTYSGGLNLDGFLPGRPTPNPGSTTICGADSVVRYVKRTSTDGTVSIQINSGTVPTPVRVRARTLYPTTATVLLETYSDTLSISTGLPLQRSFSLSVDQANIDGGNFDGSVATLTARLADQFSNPVPDGTVVNFIASGGAVCKATAGSCATVNGACSCDFTSQARRPKDNRVVVLAYAIGLEDFSDTNGDNLYSPGEPFIDLGDAFVDANKDGMADSIDKNGDIDILVPYQLPGMFTKSGDGVRGTAHVRASTVIYLSKSSSAGDPTAIVPLVYLNRQFNLLTSTVTSPFARLQPICPAGSPLPQTTLAFLLEDGIGNPMAAATTLSVVDASDNIASGGFRPSVVNALGARGPTPLLDQPNDVKVPPLTPFTIGIGAFQGQISTAHSVTVRGVPDKCGGSASFGLSLKSPRGGDASTRIVFDGESRGVGRFTFPVLYTDDANISVDVSGKTATLSTANWVGPATTTSGASASYVLDWGDGSKSKVGTGLIPPADRVNVYVAASTYTARLTVTESDGITVHSATTTVVVK